MDQIAFRPLARTDLPVLRDWLNTPHVFRWWGVDSGPGSLGGAGADAATAEQVEAKYGPGIDAIEHRTHRFVIEIDGRAVGLVQWYRLDDFAEYAVAIGETAPGGAGIDLFLADASITGRGLGTRVIDAFVRAVVFADPAIVRAVAGPRPDNAASWRAFEKAGFVVTRDVDVPDEGPERIVVRRRADSA
jgi:aminoglycoside 6'-N-acetyltransferase